MIQGNQHSVSAGALICHRDHDDMDMCDLHCVVASCHEDLVLMLWLCPAVGEGIERSVRMQGPNGLAQEC